MIDRLLSKPSAAARVGLLLLFLVSLVLVFTPHHYLTMALQNSSAGLLVATAINAVFSIAVWLAGGIGVGLLTAYFVWRMNQSARSSVVIGRRDSDTSD